MNAMSTVRDGLRDATPAAQDAATMREGERDDPPTGQRAPTVRDGSRDGAACLVCGRTCPSGRARYCSRACQQQAYRARHHQPSAALAAARQQLQRQRRLVAQTVYICPRCDERYLGERRCPECHVFCRAAGLGGHCSDCDAVILLADLLDLAEVLP